MRAEMAGRTGHDIIHPDVTHLEDGPRIFFVDRLMQARPAAVNGEARTPASAEGSLLVTICQARTSPRITRSISIATRQSLRLFDALETRI